MIVSISRELGAGGGSVGEAIATELGAKFLDERTMIDELSSRLGFSPAYIAQADERPPALGSSLMWQLAQASAMLTVTAPRRLPEDEMVDGVHALVIEYAQAGHVVVVGHGGRAMLGWRPHRIPILAILLKAGRGWRIHQLVQRYAIEEREAERRIARTDEARIKYQKHFFDSDIYDSRQYDLVLDTERIGLEMAIDVATRVARGMVS